MPDRIKLEPNIPLTLKLPRLFDRGTGTHGPAPALAAVDFTRGAE